MENLLALALANLKRYKRIFKSSTISIVISVFLILFFYSLHSGFEVIIENEIAKNHSFKQISILADKEDTDVMDNKKFFSISDVQLLKHLKDVKSVSINNRFSSPILSCEIDGLYIEHPDYLIGSNVQYSTFSWAQTEWHKGEDASFSEMVAGRNFQNGDINSCIIEESSVSMLGLKEVEEIIGKTLCLALYNGEKVQIDIIGVYSKELGGNPDIEFGESLFYTEDGLLSIGAESIILSYDVVEKLNAASGISSTEYSDITLSMADLNSTLSIFNTLTSKYYNQMVCDSDAINKALDYLKLFSNIFVFLGILLLMLSAFNISSTVMMVAENRKKWFALQNIVGFRKQQVAFCYIFEILFTVIKGFLVGTIIVALLAILLFGLINNMFPILNNISISAFLPSLEVWFILFSVLLLFVLLISFGVTKRIKRIDVIKTLA